MPAERRVRRQQRRVGIVHRDSQKTRARILKAATAEFAAKGFAGARVARIAHRARVNRAMLYYYYGHKRRLFEETLRRATDRVLQVTWNAEDPVASVLAWFRVATRDPRVVRLLQWESLEGRSVGAEATGQRHNAFTSLARVFGDDVHACHKALLVVSAAVVPVAFPRLTQMFLGSRASEPVFASAHEDWIRTLATSLTDAYGRPADKDSNATLR